MTPPDYKETAAKLTGHEDCPHWMDDDHYCRKCEAIGPVLKALTQADALGYARGREEALGKWLRRWPSCSRQGLCREKWEGPALQDDCYSCDQRQLLEAEFGRWSRALTAEPAKEKP